MLRNDSGLWIEGATVTVYKTGVFAWDNREEIIPIKDGIIPDTRELSVFHCIDKILNGTTTCEELTALLNRQSAACLDREIAIDITGLRTPIIHHPSYVKLAEPNHFIMNVKIVSPFVYALLRNAPDIAKLLTLHNPKPNHTFHITAATPENRQTFIVGEIEFIGGLTDILFNRANYQRSLADAIFMHMNRDAFATALMLAYLKPSISAKHELDIEYLLCRARLDAITQAMAKEKGSTDFVVTQQDYEVYNFFVFPPASVFKDALLQFPSLSQHRFVLNKLPALISHEAECAANGSMNYKYLDAASRARHAAYLNDYAAMFKEMAELAHQQIQNPVKVAGLRP